MLPLTCSSRRRRDVQPCSHGDSREQLCLRPPGGTLGSPPHTLVTGSLFPADTPPLQRWGLGERLPLPGPKLPPDRPTLMGGRRQKPATRTCQFSARRLAVTVFANANNSVYSCVWPPPRTFKSHYFPSIRMCPWHRQGCPKSVGLRKFPG